MFDELNVEQIEITINPETLDYKMEVNYCRLDHIEVVLRDILRRIEENDLGEEIEKTDDSETDDANRQD